MLNKWLTTQHNKLKAQSNSNLGRQHNFSFNAIGVIKSDPTSKIPYLYVAVDPNILNYYNWILLQQGVRLTKPKLGAHITLLSREPNIPAKVLDPFLEKEIAFTYWDLVSDGKHWWLEVSSPQIEALRTSLGLTPRPRSGLHITIGKIV